MPVLDDVDFSSCRVDADTEAFDVVIPDDSLSLGWDEGIDGALDDFGHGAFSLRRIWEPNRYPCEANGRVF